MVSLVIPRPLPMFARPGRLGDDAQGAGGAVTRLPGMAQESQPRVGVPQASSLQPMPGQTCSVVIHQSQSYCSHCTLA